MRGFRHLMAGLLLAIVAAGCMGSDDERRSGALGEGEQSNLSWGGEWSPETEYREGTVVTHEGATFVAVGAPTEAPDPRCESTCAWTVMAEGGEAINTAPPPPPPKIQVFEYTTGYDGPVELPTFEFVNYFTVGADFQRWQQEVNDWLAGIAPWVIRHRDSSGTLVGDKLVDQGGSYLVFARGVFVSVPGLGKTPTPAPQGSNPTLASTVSSGAVNIGGLLKGPLPSLNASVLRALRGPGVSDYSLTCTLTANREPLDEASMSLTEKGTASASLMGFYVAPADVRFSVGCAHNGAKAGPFVRDLRLVAVKLD